MDNETLVSMVQQGIDRQENLLQLYNNNLPIIRRIVRPYTAYEDEADLLQQSYFSLLEAVERYNPDKGANFCTYLIMWTKQGIIRYIESAGRTVRLPAYFSQRIRKYKKFTTDFLLIHGRYPTIEESCLEMELSPERIEEIILYAQNTKSLDEEIQTDSDSFTVADTIASPEELEENVIESIYADYEKTILWDICKKYLSENENTVIERRFKQQLSLQQIGDSMGLTREYVRQLENKALLRLHRGKALREIRERLYIIENNPFNSGLRAFNEHGASEVERRVLRMEEIKEEMKRLYAKYGYSM